MSDQRIENRLFQPGHPLWLVGFRSFFILAMLAGLILPTL